MFFHANRRKIYLQGWKWNCARIMTVLSQIVEGNGGKLIDNQYDGVVINGAKEFHATRLSYIKFTLNGSVFYLQFDENPFFQFFYQIYPFGEDQRGYYLEVFPKESWMSDNVYADCDMSEIIRCAEAVYDTLIKMPISGKPRSR